MLIDLRSKIAFDHGHIPGAISFSELFKNNVDINTKIKELEEIKRAISSYDFSNYDGLIFCGYGEPTCEVEKLFAIAKWFKEQYNLPVRVNTNGLGNVYNQRDILPELAPVVDAYSISLNAPNAKRYEELVRPNCPDAFEQVLGFAREAVWQKKEVVLSVLSLLSPEEIEQSRQIAKELGVPLKVRSYTEE